MRRYAPTLALLLASCAGSHVTFTGEPRYGKTAEEDFKAGEDEFKDESWAEAVKFFEHVKNKYPFSKLATLAELRLADAKFEQERFVEAADAYKSFVKLHPTHEMADYAAFRVGLSHLREAPGDFFLFPASFEKDQAEVKTAISHLQEFLASHPDSKHVSQARELIAEANDKLAEHDWYVAQYYRKRGRWPGVAVRLEALVRDYPASRRESDALFELAEAYLHVNERYRAQQALQQLIVKHPDSPRRAEAEKRLAQLR